MKVDPNRHVRLSDAVEAAKRDAAEAKRMVYVRRAGVAYVTSLEILPEPGERTIYGVTPDGVLQPY